MAELFAKAEIRLKIEALIDGEEIVINRRQSVTLTQILNLRSILQLSMEDATPEDVDLFLRYLGDRGYFNMLPIDESKENGVQYNPCTLTVPNFEIKEALRDACRNGAAFMQQHVLKPENIVSYLKALEGVAVNPNGNTIASLASAIAQLYSGNTKLPKNEDAFHCVLYTLVYDQKMFDVHTELGVKRAKRKPGPGGLPRLDILVIYNKTGILIKIKVDPTNDEAAHDQIIDREYFKVYERDTEIVEKKVYAGVSLYKEKKKVVVRYTVDSLEKKDTRNVSRAIARDN